MSTSNGQNSTFIQLSPDHIIPNDPVATIWAWCIRNEWDFIPDLTGAGEALVDIRAAHQLAAPQQAWSTAMQGETGCLKGVPKFNRRLVRLSDVVALMILRTGTTARELDAG